MSVLYQGLIKIKPISADQDGNEYGDQPKFCYVVETSKEVPCDKDMYAILLNNTELEDDINVDETKSSSSSDLATTSSSSSEEDDHKSWFSWWRTRNSSESSSSDSQNNWI